MSLLIKMILTKRKDLLKIYKKIVILIQDKENKKYRGLTLYIDKQRENELNADKIKEMLIKFFEENSLTKEKIKAK